jgi:hypothetical protein
MAGFDWSIEINRPRHEHVSGEIVETLVECAPIVAEKSLTRVETASCSNCSIGWSRDHELLIVSQGAEALYDAGAF